MKKRKKSNPNKKIKIGTLNVRTLKNAENLVELEEAFLKSNIDILGLSEIKRRGEIMMTTQKGNLLYYKGNNLGQRGIGFIIKKEYAKEVTEIKGISDRVATLELKTKKTKVTCIQVYAPTSSAEEKEIDEFYNNVSTVYNELRKKDNIILLMGDWNSQVGKREKGEKSTIGEYGYGKRNERGWRLVRYCQEYNLKIINGYFKKRMGKRWTWQAPNQEFKSTIDYIITTKSELNVTNFEIMGMNKFNFYTDHRLLMATIELGNQKGRQKMRETDEEIDTTLFKEELRKEMSNVGSEESIDEMYNKGVRAIKSAIQKAKNKSNVESKSTGVEAISLKQLHKKRAEILKIKNKSNKEKIELNVISKLIRNKIRQREEQIKNKIISETIDGNKNLKSMKKRLRLGTQLITHFENTKGEKIHNRRDINEHISEYYKNLYSNDKNEEVVANNERNQIEIPPFLKEEIEIIIKGLKPRKAAGHDKIKNEHIKMGGEGMIEFITELSNRILEKNETPEDWSLVDTIILHKKGNRHKIENYRPIALKTTISKIFSKLIANRIQSLLNDQQPIEQAGFRKSFSTVDHLHVINQLLEKSNEYKIKLNIALIDYNKAFDSINHNYLIKALRNQGVPESYIQIIKQMYAKNKTRIITDIEGEYFEVKKGVKQGDPLSSILFNCALEEIFRKLNWEGKGINVNGVWLSNLRFADDIVLIAKSNNELTEMISELKEKSNEAGLTMNLKKSKKLVEENEGSESQKKYSENEEENIETVSQATYLGQQIAFKNRTEIEVNARITKAWNKYWSLKEIFKGPFKNEQKSEIFNMCIIPTLAYGSQTWTLTSKIINKLKVTQNSIERSILNVKKKDHVKIQTLKQKLGNNVNIINYIRKQKWKWAGHTARLKDNRWTYKVTFWYLSYLKRNRGRQLARWEDDINAFLGTKNFARIALDRIEWTRLQDTFAHFGPRVWK